MLGFLVLLGIIKMYLDQRKEDKYLKEHPNEKPKNYLE